MYMYIYIYIYEFILLCKRKPVKLCLVSLEPLKYSQKGSILLEDIIPPPSPPLSFPRLFNSELLGCLSHSIRGAPTANVPKSKRKYLLTRKHDWQIRYRYRIITSLSLCQTNMNWNGMYISLSGCRSSGSKPFELKAWTFYIQVP